LRSILDDRRAEDRRFELAAILFHAIVGMVAGAEATAR
jgi:hypothetical protein